MLLHIVRTLFVINFVIHNFNEFNKRDSRSCDVSIIGSTGNYASHNIYCSILPSMNVHSVARYWRFQSTTTPTCVTRFLRGFFFFHFHSGAIFGTKFDLKKKLFLLFVFWKNVYYRIYPCKFLHIKTASRFPIRRSKRFQIPID